MNKRNIGALLVLMTTLAVYQINKVQTQEITAKASEATSSENIITVNSENVELNNEVGVTEVKELEKEEEQKEPEVIGYIFIGDSRTVGMNDTINIDSIDNQWVVAKVGMGYKWLIDEGWAQAQQVMRNNTQVDNWKIICNLGVNDLCNIDKYLDFYKENNDRYDITFVSVNPTVDEAGGVQCSDIESFNNEVEKLDMKYIDTYSYLKTTGYNAPDGLHYDKKTYEKIYDVIMEQV